MKKTWKEYLNDAKRRDYTGTNPFFKTDTFYTSNSVTNISGKNVKGEMYAPYIARAKTAMNDDTSINTQEFYFSLEKREQLLFMYISFNIRPYDEVITIKYKDVVETANINRNYVSKAIKGLIAKNVLLHYEQSKYYFNPLYFFKGRYYEYREAFYNKDMYEI